MVANLDENANGNADTHVNPYRDAHSHPIGYAIADEHADRNPIANRDSDPVFDSDAVAHAHPVTDGDTVADRDGDSDAFEHINANAHTHSVTDADTVADSDSDSDAFEHVNANAHTLTDEHFDADTNLPALERADSELLRPDGGGQLGANAG